MTIEWPSMMLPPIQRVVRVIAAAKLGVKAFVWLILAFMLLMFLKDGPAEYKDVSHQPDHASWVGRRCTVLQGLVALGVTLYDLGPNQITDVVDISTQGTTGPEINFRTSIHKGMDMLITSVEECTNCLFPLFPKLRFGVTIIPNLPELAPYRVFANSYTLVPDQVQCVKDSSPATP